MTIFILFCNHPFSNGYVPKMVNMVKLIIFVLAVVSGSLILQIIIYIIGAIACELIGIQAQNAFCQVYFIVEAVDPMRDNGTSGPKRWCLLWQEGPSKQRGIRCTRAGSFFDWSYRGETTAAVPISDFKTAKTTTTPVPKNTEAPEPTMPVPDLIKVRQLLPLITLSDKALTPKILITRRRQRVDLVITLSIYKLVDHSKGSHQQLFSTLDSLFFSLPPADQHKCLVMVFVTEILDDKYVENLTSKLLIRYNIQIETGLMEILVPREGYYNSMFFPKIGSISRVASEQNKRRNRYRRKQCMDLIYMMMLGYLRGKLYLQLRHDVITRQDFVASINQALANYNSSTPDWIMMHFASGGIIGKLMRTSDVPEIAQYLSRLSMNKPADYHFESFVKGRACQVEKGPNKGMTKNDCSNISEQLYPQAKPVLFQLQQIVERETPVHAWRDGDKTKTDMNIKQKSSARGHDDLPVAPTFKSQNLEGYVPCSTIRFTNDMLPVIMKGEWPYVVKGATHLGRIDIKFSPPLDIYRLQLVTGLPGNPDSSFREDTSVWVYTEKYQKFTNLGHLSPQGRLDITLPPGLEKVHVLEILMGQAHPKQEVFLNKLMLMMRCRESIRMHLSSTATIQPTPAPVWYIPPPKALPRREGPVLVSY